MPKSDLTAKEKLKAMGDRYRLPVVDSPEPSWTLDQGLSFSGFDLWLRCKEQFRLSYIQGWKPVEQQDGALYFGSIMHKLIEDRPNGGNLRELEDSMNTVTTTLADANILKAKAAAVYRVYETKHEVHTEDRIDCGAEKRFHYNYGFKCNGKNYDVPLMGFIDCVYRSDKRGNIGIRETKTRSQMDLDNTTVALVADLQVNSYFLACEQELGKFPTELIYDLVKKPGHEPLSANTKRDKEGLHDFHNRVFDAVNNDPESFLVRIKYRRSLAEFNNWRQQVLEPHLAEFVEWYRKCEKAKWKQVNPYNPSALVGKYGLCKLFHLVVSGDVSGLTKRDNRRGESKREEASERVSARRPNRAKR